MKAFRYQAYSDTGALVEGEVRAASREEALEIIRGRGHIPFSAEERAATAAVDAEPWWRRDLFGRDAVSSRDLTALTQGLATLIEAGLPLDDALGAMLAQQTRPPLRRVLESVRESVQGGAPLADALRKHPRTFPGIYIAMVRAGEASGALGDVLARLAAFLERREEVRGALRSALIYPVILILTAIISLTLVMTVVLPGLAPLFAQAGDRLPPVTRGVLAVSDFLRGYWWALLGGILASIGLFLLWRRSRGNRRILHGVILRLPWIGQVVFKAEGGRFVRTLGALLANGVALDRALTIAREVVVNLAMAEAVDKVEADVRQGRRLGEAMSAAGAFPDVALRLISVGDRIGQLGPMALKAADVLEDEARRAVQDFLAILTPALTLGLGALVAGVILAVISALLSVNDLPF